MASRQAADMLFAQAIRLEAAGAPVQDLVVRMESAVKKDPANVVLWRNLATAYLGQTGVVLQAALRDGELGPEEGQQVRSTAEMAARAADKATDLGESDSANWSIAGMVYAELMPFIPNAQNYSATAYTKAIQLEPGNPSHRTELGRVYLAVADRAHDLQEAEELDAEARATAAANEEENLRIAGEHFEMAVRLKPDYAPAHYYLAATYERQGKLAEAAERLSELAQVQPHDAGLSFQLAVIYLKMKDYDQAEAELERTLTISPNYSNALWYLAAIKANAGQTQAALDVLQQLEILHPNNEVIKASIDNLVAGLDAPADPGPLTIDDAADALPGPNDVSTE